MILFSCVESDKELKKKEAAILVGDEFLLADEIKSLIIDTGNPKDTIGTVKQSVDDWMAESLLYQEALSKLNEEEIQIESQIENYRKALVNHIYSTKLIEVNLDTNVSYGEIKAYYEEHKDNFILKDNIVKVHYLKVLLKAPPLNKIKKLVYSNQSKDKEQLEDLCSQYADNYFLNDSTWIYLEDMKKEVPKLKEQDDIYLYKGKVIEVSDDEFYYFLRFNEIRIKNSVSPLNFELNNIKKFIINKRKTQLLKDYKVQLLEKAREEKRIIINSEKLKLN
ncbi:MAG: hypothetical protein IPM51_05310 [Sphingobacteriaceae bacterium]|nr:hypothetical protein [Sphingobacteriaceae bacterium]